MPRRLVSIPLWAVCKDPSNPNSNQVIFECTSLWWGANFNFFRWSLLPRVESASVLRFNLPVPPANLLHPFNKLNLIVFQYFRLVVSMSGRSAHDKSHDTDDGGFEELRDCLKMRDWSQWDCGMHIKLECFLYCQFRETDSNGVVLDRDGLPIRTIRIHWLNFPFCSDKLTLAYPRFTNSCAFPVIWYVLHEIFALQLRYMSKYQIHPVSTVQMYHLLL